MPRKKISIEEAFAALEKHGVKVQKIPDEPIPVEQQTKQQRENLDYTHYPPRKKKTWPDYSNADDGVIRKVGDTVVAVKLYAAHTVSSGGEQYIDVNGKQQMRDQSVVTYGPGVCKVPSHLAQHLLHQDGLAKETDDNMLDRTQRSYLVVQKSAGGINANVGMKVPDNWLDNLGILPDVLMHFVR